MLNILVGSEAELVSIGRGKKSWNDLGSDRKRKVSQKVYDQLEKTADERGIEPSQFAGTLLRRYVCQLIMSG